MLPTRKMFVILSFISLLFTSAELWADQQSFAPTWKLFKHREEKVQFIAGYLYAAQDFKRISEIAVNYIKDQPEKAVESLESLSRLYDFSSGSPDRLALYVDQFYADPENSSASLSKALSYAKSEMSK